MSILFSGENKKHVTRLSSELAYGMMKLIYLVRISTDGYSAYTCTKGNVSFWLTAECDTTDGQAVGKLLCYRD